MATVLLVRHAESTWNREGRVQGWAATALTERGRRQAGALAAHLDGRHDVDRLYCSDLRRAQATARAVAAATGVDPAADPAWRERDFGSLRGLAADALFERYPQYSLAEAGHDAAAERPPGGESLLEARERVLDAWRRLLGELATDDTAAVVTHGGPIRLLVGHVRGETVVDAVLGVSPDNCSVTELRVGDGEARVRRENATGFLP